MANLDPGAYDGASGDMRPAAFATVQLNAPRIRLIPECAGLPSGGSSETSTVPVLPGADVLRNGERAVAVVQRAERDHLAVVAEQPDLVGGVAGRRQVGRVDP